MNWLAIILAAVATMIVGALWYSPILFGKLWMKLSGMGGDKDAEMKKKVTQAYIIGFIGQVVLVYVLAMLFSIVGGSIYTLAFWLWLGFLATLSLYSVAWEGKSWNLYILNVAYQLVSILVAGFVLTLF